jgi:hypothetical protein
MNYIEENVCSYQARGVKIRNSQLQPKKVQVRHTGHMLSLQKLGNTIPRVPCSSLKLVFSRSRCQVVPNAR